MIINKMRLRFSCRHYLLKNKFKELKMQSLLIKNW